MASPTRTVALALLTAVLQSRRPLEEALDALPAGMAPRDRGAGHRIAATVLRRMGSLDAALEPWLKREPPTEVRNALRIGAAELLLLGTPPHAAVSDCVALVPRPFSGLVNAVLRRVSEAGIAALEGLDAPRLDTPSWLWSAWHATHGPAVRAIAEAHGHEAPLDLSLMPGAAVEGATMLPNGTARMPVGTRITEIPGFAEGRFWAQDAAASLPVRLLAPRKGERILDLCAAPGGKTAQLAAAGARVVAVEREKKRAERLAENLTRLNLPADIVVADALAWDPGTQFDAILLDAPCTATGTIRRHPDVVHLKKLHDVERQAEQQRALLAVARGWLAPGGRLVFATCSLQGEEGEAHFPNGLDAVRPEEVPGLEGAITAGGAVRTRPDMWGEWGGLDGFFIARIRR